VTKFIALTVTDFVTPKAGAKHEPLLNKPTAGAVYTAPYFLRNIQIGQINVTLH